MVLAIISLIISHISCASKCTNNNNKVLIQENKSFDEIIDENRPTFLRLYNSKYSSFSNFSNAQWDKVTQLFPQVNFVTVDCFKNVQICSLFDSQITQPLYSISLPGRTTYVKESLFKDEIVSHNNNHIFVDTIKKYAHLYPILPPINTITPNNFDLFNQNTNNKILIIFDSNCPEHDKFLNYWLESINKYSYKIKKSLNFSILDCSKYQSFCQKHSFNSPEILFYEQNSKKLNVLSQENANIEYILSKIHIHITNLKTKSVQRSQIKADSSIYPPIPSHSHNYCGDNLVYRFYNLDTMKISGSGDMYNYSLTSLPPYTTETKSYITIEDGITSIGDYAFYNLNFYNFSIPDTVTHIGKSAFELTHIGDFLYIPDSVISISESAFYDCYVKSIRLPNNLKRIEDKTFFQSIIVNLTISDSVTFLGSEILAYTQVSNITIPENLISISRDAFDATNLLEINVNEKNTKFTSLNGVLFSKDMTKIIAYPAGKYGTSYEIPNSVVSIEDYAFARSSITNLTIPDTVTNIGSMSFYYSKIKSIIIPDSVTFISGQAFNQSRIETIVLSKNLNNINSTFLIGSKYVKSITFSDNNENYKAIDNVLFSSDETTLILYAAGNTQNSFTIPNTVTYIDEYAFNSCQNLVSITIPNSVSYIGKGAFYECATLQSVAFSCEIQTINESLFYRCTSLESITFPTSITKICNYAFYGCSKLSYIPETVIEIDEYALGLCRGLVSISLHEDLRTIENGTFYSCSSLELIKLPQNLISIGDDAFRSCSKLKNISIPNTVTYIGNYAFRDCTRLQNLSIPDNLAYIGDYAFYRCTRYENISIPDTVTYIGEYAFGECPLKSIILNGNIKTINNNVFQYTNLEDVTIPEGITSIGRYSFDNCKKLKSIIIPNTVTSIGAYAFGSCKLITNITIPNSVLTIGSSCFSFCSNLISIEMHDNIELIDDEAFSNCQSIQSIKLPSKLKVITNGLFNNCRNLTTINIPEGVEILYKCCFQYCISLNLINIPKDVSYIGVNSFYSCTNLESITIPEKVTCIEDYTFYNCGNLTSISLNDNIKYIGDYSFYECKKMSLTSLPDSITTIGDSSFYFCKKIKFVNFPNDLTYIGPRAFQLCGSFEHIILGKNLEIIDRNAFYSCSNIKIVNITSHLKRIERNAFDEMRKLEIVNISCDIDFIDEYVFYNVPKLKEFYYYGLNTFSTGTGCFLINHNLPKIMVLPECRLTLPMCSGNSFIDRTLEEKFPCGENVYYKQYFNRLQIFGSGPMKNFELLHPSNFSKIEVVIFENGVTTVGDYAFYKSTNLLSCEIPESIISIGHAAFGECINLTKLNLHDEITYIGGSAFRECDKLEIYKLPPKLDKIESYSFFGCKKLNISTLPNNINYIGERAFGNTNISSIEIPNKVTEIGLSAFTDSQLSSIVLPNSLLKIGDFAFSSTLLTTLTIPSNVNSIGINIVYNVKTMNSFIVDNNNPYFKVEDDVLLSKNGSIMYSYPYNKLNKEYDIPKTVTQIQNYTFLEIPKLTTLNYVRQNEPICSKDSFISMKQIYKVNVLLTYENSSFCGLRINKILEDTGPEETSNVNDYSKSNEPPNTEIISIQESTSVNDYSESYKSSNSDYYYQPEEPTKESSIQDHTNSIETSTPSDQNVPCLVDGCILCVEGSSTECAVCNSSLELNIQNQCVTPLIIPEKPTYIPIYDNVNYDDVDNDGHYNLDTEKQKETNSSEILIIQLNNNNNENKKISEITIKNSNNKNVAIEINEGYSDLTIKVDPNTNNTFNILPSSNSLLTLNLDTLSHASIIEAKGTVEIKSIEENGIVKLNEVNPSTEDFTLIPSSQVTIDLVDFNDKQSLIINSPDNSKVEISSMKVQQKSFGKIQNATITGNVIFGLESTLEINQFVDLSKSSIDLSFSNSRNLTEKAQIIGVIDSIPQSITIKNRQENTYLQQQNHRILIAESDEKFKCDEWGKTINFDKSSTSINDYECAEPANNGKKTYRLYGYNNKNKGKNDGKDGLSGGIIAAIVIAVVVVVGVIIFIIVYFLKIKKKSDDSSQQEDSNDQIADEV